MAIKEELLHDVLRLPVKERARLAHELLLSLDEAEDANAEEAWLTELERRADEVLSGKAKLEKWGDVRQRILTRLRNPH